MSFFKKLKNKVRSMENQLMQPPTPPQMPPYLDFLGKKGDRPSINFNRPTSISPLGMPSRNLAPRFSGGGLRSIFSRLIRNNPKFRGIQRQIPMPPAIPNNMMAAPSLPMPENMPVERFPMERPGFSVGRDVVQSLVQSRAGPIGQYRTAINLADKILGNVPVAGNITGALSKGISSIPTFDKFAKTLFNPATYKQTGKIKDRRMELPRFTQDRQADFDENIQALERVASRKGFAGGEDVDINTIIAEQGARESISPPEMKAQSIKEFLGETGRTISNRDAELYGMGLLSFEELMQRVQDSNMREILGESGRTLSNMDRNLLQQEQMFFPESGSPIFNRISGRTISNKDLNELNSLDELIDNLEKKN